MPMGAGHEGVAAGQPVSEALIEQEIQGPVYRDGRKMTFAALAFILAQDVGNIVGSERSVCLVKGFQNLPANTRQPYAPCRADFFSFLKGSGGALRLMMGVRTIAILVVMAIFRCHVIHSWESRLS